MAQVGSGERRTRFQEPHLSPHDKIDGQHVEASGHHSVSDEPRDVVPDEEAATNGAAALVSCGRADKDEEDDGEADREDGADRVQPEVELLVIDLAACELQVADPAKATRNILTLHHVFQVSSEESSVSDWKPVNRR